jgi:hypothetical protein
LTPSRNVNFFGGNTTGGDRFIPTRSDNQYELASFHMSSSMHQVFIYDYVYVSSIQAQ